MVTIVKLIGAIFIALGLSFVFNPKSLRKLIEFFCQDKRVYMVAILRISLGIIFLISARECRNTTMMIAIGVIVLFAGIFIFILGTEKIAKITGQVINSSDLSLRIISLVPIILGALILYSA